MLSWTSTATAIPDPLRHWLPFEEANLTMDKTRRPWQNRYRLGFSKETY
jgi:hypothetical protein